jgi:TonB-linked SusC/RagA family outer membrane protein
MSNKPKSYLSKILFLFALLFSTTLVAQDENFVRGKVIDDRQDPVIGATVILKGSPSVGTVSDVNGDFSLEIPQGNQTLIISFIGMETIEIEVSGRDFLDITLKDQSFQLDETIIVGFGQQKKASVVGSIAQTTGDVLERSGGVSSLGTALTGNLPGVVTIASTGIPGMEDPKIIIRGQSTWNNSDPLVLVDGIEREMSSIDINSVETISVLKDASATAVYGVRGANGVILINTKKGREGKARIDVGFSSTMKTASKLPGKLDSYDAFQLKNMIVEYELANRPDVWTYITPQEVIERYRNHESQEDMERYPNVDWEEYLFKDFAMSYNANINVSGGTPFVKYFSSIDYLHEGDLYDVWDNSRGYNTGFGFNRLNTRTNLDFQLTKTTKFSTNLFGSYGVRQAPWTEFEYRLWAGAYGLPPDAYYPKHADGTWGFFYPADVEAPNSAMEISINGKQQTTTTRLNADFVLEQELDIILKGLKLRAAISWDIRSIEGNRGINDLYNGTLKKWINPETGEEVYSEQIDANTNFDWEEGVKWSNAAGSMQNWSTRRTLNYSLQLNYFRELGEHTLGAMGNMSRQEIATGSGIPSYREDWVFRTTYDYGSKYFIEYNGAYNGSERFGIEYRFAFFSSGALGWMLSNEKFMENLAFLDMLKLRASYGTIGDDNVSGDRWLYETNWAYGNNSWLGTLQSERSPYTWYKENVLGNPNVRWESVTKTNFGLDYAVFNGLFSGSFDVFKDLRKDILITGRDRAIPSYFGVNAPVANLGKVEIKGFEFELKYNKRINRNLRLWGNLSMTHAKDIILERDDPALYPDYLKQAGFANGQARTHLTHGYYNTWDEMYASTQFESNDDSKIPGNFYIVDFNADGVIDDLNDRVPYAYSGNPQNTYNSTVGVDWKGWSAFAQFYGVSNVSRAVSLNSFHRAYINTAYEEGEFWSKENTNPDTPLPRLSTTPHGAYKGDLYQYDGSYIRLRNAEIAYTFSRAELIGLAGLESLRIYMNGNNLWFWTRMPDDRESNMVGGVWSNSTYPTMRRFNIGVRVTF